MVGATAQEGRQRDGRQGGAAHLPGAAAVPSFKPQHKPTSRTCVVMASESWRAASSADSLTRLASSAPLKPGVRRASSSAGGWRKAGGVGQALLGGGGGSEPGAGGAALHAHPPSRLPTEPGAQPQPTARSRCSPRTGVDIRCHRLAGQIEVQDFLAAPHIRQRDSNLGEAEKRRARNTSWKFPTRQWQAARARALLAWF